MLVTVDPRQVKEKVSRALASFPEVVGAYHFGSSLEECRPDSDIDIGLIVRPGTIQSNRDLDELVARILREIRPLQSHRFDIVTLDRDRPLFTFKVIHEGRRIYEYDLNAILDFVEIVSRRYGEDAPRYQRALEEALGIR